MEIAQTNVKLYNQLREQGLPVDDLVVVHRAYELLTTLYPGYYQADGKPFVAHGVGVASILGWLDQPAEIIAVGMLHNIYGNADFGDRSHGGRTPFRGRLVRDAVGERIEELLARFPDLRISPSTVEEVRRALPERGDTDRRLLLVDLADHLEKYVDLGVLYYPENDWITYTSDRIGDDLVEIARELGEPRLGDLLATAFADAATQAPLIPAALRPSDGSRYAKLVVPRSCRRRLSLTVRLRARRARRQLRLKTRLRRLRSTATDLIRA